MRCSICGVREATTEVLKQHNNHIERMYLCSECAKKANIGFGGFGLSDFFAGSPMGLVNSGLFVAPSEPDKVCPECTTKASEFIKTGYVGCPKCYSVFEPLVLQTVRKLQQSNIHVGKNPFARPEESDEVTRLKVELELAIAARDYPKIAECSSRLSALGVNGNGGDK